MTRFLNIMKDLGYQQYKDYPHTFIKDDIMVDFEPESGFAACACADFGVLPVNKLDGAEFKELNRNQNLNIYKKAMQSCEKKFESMKRKVQLLEQKCAN